MLFPYMVEFKILIELRLMGLILRRFKALIEVPSKKMITASIIKHQKLPHLRPKLPMVTRAQNQNAFEKRNVGDHLDAQFH